MSSPSIARVEGGGRATSPSIPRANSPPTNRVEVIRNDEADDVSLLFTFTSWTTDHLCRRMIPRLCWVYWRVPPLPPFYPNVKSSRYTSTGFSSVTAICRWIKQTLFKLRLKSWPSIISSPVCVSTKSEIAHHWYPPFSSCQRWYDAAVFGYVWSI